MDEALAALEAASTEGAASDAEAQVVRLVDLGEASVELLARARAAVAERRLQRQAAKLVASLGPSAPARAYRVAAALGDERLVRRIALERLSEAATKPTFDDGDVVALEETLNFVGDDPAVAAPLPFVPRRFPPPPPATAKQALLHQTVSRCEPYVVVPPHESQNSFENLPRDESQPVVALARARLDLVSRIRASDDPYVDLGGYRGARSARVRAERAGAPPPTTLPTDRQRDDWTPPSFFALDDPRHPNADDPALLVALILRGPRDPVEQQQKPT